MLAIGGRVSALVYSTSMDNGLNVIMMCVFVIYS